VYGEINEPGLPGKSLDQQGKARLFVALGKIDKITPRKLTRLILKRVSIKSKEMSDIQILDNFSFVTVPFEYAEKIIQSFKEKGRKPLIAHVKKKRKK